MVLNGLEASDRSRGRDARQISSRIDEDVVVTEIRDQGGGFPPDLQDKIFELYFTTKKDGSGIGLAQTYQILQWHYTARETSSRRREAARRFASVCHWRKHGGVFCGRYRVGHRRENFQPIEAV